MPVRAAPGLGKRAMSVDNINAIAGSATALAAMFGVFVAWRGLATWKHELAGRHEYELARRLAISVYKCQAKTKRVRNSYISPGEFAAALAARGVKLEDVAEDKRDLTQTAAVYETRWAELVDARGSIDADLLEAAAVWGDDWLLLVEPLDTLHRKLYVAIRRHLRSRDPGQAHRASPENEEQTDELIYEGLVEPDKFSASYSQGVGGIAKRLRPHMKAR